ncbi:Serine/threonine-protein kinase [Tilletia horrida]|uniref:non-specific serine/threonine protein kinase n=1 Tax=Tilletia horrida TaxID=155126 RepID=A0AAN6G8B5_9BASI|nr:Serine/threonine-protein kinase [Tilletia horrida]
MSSWKLGKKRNTIETRSPGALDRSATPTPGHPGAAGAAGADGAALGGRSGLLAIKVVDAQNLALPPGDRLPPAIERALQTHAASSSSSSAAAGSAGALPSSSAGQRQSMQRRPCWWLPYLVLEFDRNEILIDAIGGQISNPTWLSITHFDVSRPSEISLQVYLRTNERPGAAASGAGGDPDKTMTDAPGVGANGGGGGGGDGDVTMGDTDRFLGGVKFVPDFDDALTQNQLCTYKLQGPGVNAQIRVQFTFHASQGTGSGSGLTIESFELLKVIGKGSFGKVMQVRKRDTGRIYALKTIRKAHIVSRSEVTHTLAERTVLARVNNPFIVPLKFSFQSPEKLYLVLAFVNGGELFHHLQREGRFSETRSRFYAAELLCALEHLHSFNVVYRDLKPENILLDYTGHIALCDFGLCKLDMTEDRTTNTFCGTPEYLAPELLGGEGYTKAVDWWTLGVLLYEMLTGLPPFYSEDVNVMYTRILQDPLRFGEEVKPDARDLLVQLLERDPRKRLGSQANGAQLIKAHPFFSKHIDWELLLAKKVQPPFKPAVASAIDTSNFDPEFTSEPAMDSVVDDGHMLSATMQEQFVGFSYTGPQDLANGEAGRA